jgi:nicotinic acetylcholine receptor
MRFGSWTFDAHQVRLRREKKMVNLEDYLPSGTWDVIEAPGTDFSDGNRMELVYTFKIRRKTLFYTVNLIIPTVLISFLSIFVFYLPTDEGEKMTLCISILLALVVFLLLVSKILPPTSMVIPLISKYLIFTLMMNIITILNTVIIINWNYRTPRTHNMPKWVRIVFINFLPSVLFMKRPEQPDDENDTVDSLNNVTKTNDQQIKIKERNHKKITNNNNFEYKHENNFLKLIASSNKNNSTSINYINDDEILKQQKIKHECRNSTLLSKTFFTYYINYFFF